jgi:hypothetical protein
MRKRKPNVSQTCSFHFNSLRDGAVGESGMVPCPICNKTTRSDRINEHIDSGCRAVYSSEGSSSKAAQSKRAWLGIFQASTNGSSSGKAKGKARATQRCAVTLRILLWLTVLITHPAQKMKMNDYREWHTTYSKKGQSVIYYKNTISPRQAINRHS